MMCPVADAERPSKYRMTLRELEASAHVKPEDLVESRYLAAGG